MQRAYEVVAGSEGMCSEYEMLLHVGSLAVGGGALLVGMGEEGFGWNTRSVQALEQRFARVRAAPFEKAEFAIAACVGDFARNSIGGDWVFAGGVTPAMNGTDPNPGDVMVRLSNERRRPNVILSQGLPEGGTLFDPFQAVADWLSGDLPSPFLPLYEIVGPPLEAPSVPAASHVHQTLPVMQRSPKQVKPQKKRK